MKTRSELITDFTTLSRDSSTANTALGRNLIDIYTNKILAMKDWTFNRGSIRMHAVDGEWSYPKAYNTGKIIGIKTEVEDNVYWPTEIVNRDDWERLTGSRTAVESDITTRYFIDTNSIEVYPCPTRSATDKDFYITQFYTKVVSSRSASDYTTGTVSRSASSRSVYGTGTTFTWPMVGRYIRISDEDEWYEISEFRSTTQIITSRESRTAADDEAYTISEVIPLPQGAESIPLWGALMIYFQSSENPAQAQQYKQLYDEGVLNLIRGDSKSTGNVLERDDLENTIIDVNKYPEDLS